ncbi:peptide deformylase [Alphaproteobacteria bacterium endosymbiont of Tiliacea citrago]|uniref:peptide deformylase n=1 Tax=Alphaproteobacteria bacterium endosymbiont of Tiliacea citrago TaxID=3077944 RepID=UPI00313C6D05
MQLLKIIKAFDQRLFKKAQKVTVFDDYLEEFSENLRYTMNALGGCGLAAIQVEDDPKFQLKEFDNYRAQPNIIIIQPSDADFLVAINPEITHYSTETDFSQEGCLSIPGKKSVAKIERSISIKVKYQNLQGKEIENTLTNEAARIFQHEYDHNIGILFPQRLESSRENFFWIKYRQEIKRK